jgi:hypothetical protein
VVDQPITDVTTWLGGRTGILSIDADFFCHYPERQLAPRMGEILARMALRRPVTFCDEHVDLVRLVCHQVDFIVNFDFHMDCRIEFLHGTPPLVPPASNSVFETLLADGLVQRYVWAFPTARRAVAAQVYASAALADRQPLLQRIHAVPGEAALCGLGDAMIDSAFVCRSPAYATPETDAVHDMLRARVGV